MGPLSVWTATEMSPPPASGPQAAQPVSSHIPTELSRPRDSCSCTLICVSYPLNDASFLLAHYRHREQPSPGSVNCSLRDVIMV